MIRFSLSILLICLIFFSCSKTETQAPQLTPEAQRKVDSLVAFNDSVAKDKELHYQFQGTHAHLNASGKLSEHAHQDLPKKRRLARLRTESRPKREEAYRKSQERQQERIEEHKRKTGKLDSTEEK